MLIVITLFDEGARVVGCLVAIGCVEGDRKVGCRVPIGCDIGMEIGLCVGELISEIVKLPEHV